MLFKTFVGIFVVELLVMCLYWVDGEGKHQPQAIANVMIYSWGFMLFGSIVGFINWLLE